MILQEIAEEFINWTKRKIRHHCNDRGEIFFREKEIWWASLGKNIGLEVDGKHELFHRPVLIIKKYNKDTCFILPLTTQIKDPLPWYQILITADNKRSAVNITQGRTISTKRLLRKMEVLDTVSYRNIVIDFKKQFI